MPISESASTRIEVIGVFSSCETFETNSSRDSFKVRSFLSVVFTSSLICEVTR